MSMELLNQFMNDAVDFTFTAIVLALTLFALAAIWKWLIGVSIRFVQRHSRGCGAFREKCLCPADPYPRKDETIFN